MNAGVEIPAFGFGVYQTPDETIASVTAALDDGYRHIDTAAAFGSPEREVGERASGHRGAKQVSLRLRYRVDRGNPVKSCRCAAFTMN